LERWRLQQISCSQSAVRFSLKEEEIIKEPGLFLFYIGHLPYSCRLWPKHPARHSLCTNHYYGDSIKAEVFIESDFPIVVVQLSSHAIDYTCRRLSLLWLREKTTKKEQLHLALCNRHKYTDTQKE
jgi:hypothetical protein